MKYCLIVFVMLLTVVRGNAQDKRGFVIEGNITGLKDSVKLYLVKDKNNMRSLDTVSTAISKKGKFFFKGEVPLECEVHYLRLDSSISKKTKTIFLENLPIKIQGSMDEWPKGISVSGSPSTDDYYGLLKILAGPQKELDSLRNRLSEIKHLIFAAETGVVTIYKDTQLLRQDETMLKSKSSELENAYYKLWTEYNDSHCNSLYIPYSIEKMPKYLGVEGMNAAYAKLTKRAQESFYGFQLRDYIAKMKLRENAVNIIKVGMKVPDLNMKSPQEDQISLKKTIASGKLTLIDFWAFWCKPCRAETPNLKKVYRAFHDRGFNIVSITSDPREMPWKKAIKDDGMSWFHGLSTEASAIFDVRGIPAYVLVDKDGVIIAMDIVQSSGTAGESGSLRDENLYNKIAELLK